MPRQDVTSSLELITTPLPAGTLATGVPLAPKLPVLLVATLPYTSALIVFSISMPATLYSARLLRTITSCDWPT